MKNNSKERLFEVMQRVAPNFKPKLNEDIETSVDKKIRTTFQTVTPESAENGDFSEQGWEDQEGVSMVPDEYDVEDGITAVNKAVDFLFDKGGTEPSSSQFSPNTWYSTPDADHDYSTGEDTYYSFHLVGFTPEEEKEIFDTIHNKRYRTNEAIGGGQTATTNPDVQQPKQPGDVAALGRATNNAATVTKASGYINTAFEFPEAFRLWFSSLGVAKNHAIPKGTIIRNVSQILDSMDYK